MRHSRRHHVQAEQLTHYMAEFDFRSNERTVLGGSDADRFDKAIPGLAGKRLTYRRTGREGAPVRA